MQKFIVPIVAAIVALVLGVLIGRWSLEREWSNPMTLISPSDEERSKQNDADPTPTAGSRILKAVPLRRARQIAAQMTSSDPLVARVGSVGNSDEGAELHLVLENKGGCTVKSYEGVAYGYDAFGKPAKMNRGGENYARFSSEKAEIAPTKKTLHSATLRYPETASLTVAMVNRVACTDGTIWSRN